MRAVVTMVCIASVAGGVAVLRRLNGAEVVSAHKAQEEWWQRYQALRSRLRLDQLGESLSAAAGAPNPRDRYSRESRKIQLDSEQAQKTAVEAQETEFASRRKEVRFNLGQVALEVALVIALLSIAIPRRILWLGALLMALVGVAIAATVLL
jgi:Domain of unknown function (DUF4337)